MILPGADPELVAAAEFLFEVGELRTGVEVLRFFERPGRYPLLVSLWDSERASRGEAQDEFRARTP